MGQCYSKQQQQSLRTASKTPKPQKCIILQNPPSLILQLSNGNVQTINIKTNYSGSQLQYKLDSGIYLNAANQLYLCVQGDGINDMRILDAAHVYYQSINQRVNGAIQPQCAYLVRNGDKVMFIVRSKSLGEGGKFVDLVDLGRRMKDKQICWQDLEFSQIVVQICRKYAKANHKEQAIKNIFIGSDGSIHLLTFPVPESPSTKTLNHLQQLLISSLYGLPKQPPTKQFLQYQKTSQFKHNNVLSMLQNLSAIIEQQKNNKYAPITNPSLKFIRDYIIAYFYKFQVYDEDFVDMMIMIGQYESARVILDQYMSAKGFYQLVDQDTYKMYVKLLVIEDGKDPKSQQTATARARVCSAANHLAKNLKQTNNYLKSDYYFTQALTHKSSAISPTTNYKFDQQFYIDLAQVCRALNKNKECQKALLDGLDENSGSRVLNLAVIVFLCDCMRVDEAEERLMKATSGFKTLQMQISSAKILLTKAVLNPVKRSQFVKRAEEELSKVLISQYQRQSQKSAALSQFPTLALYHQTLGDCYLQQHSFPTAKQQYHTSKLIIKNYENCGYRLATLTAAQANCSLMEGNYDEAIVTYTQAEGYITNQCRNLLDSIVGNRAIAKIRKGMQEEGTKQIQAILEATPKEILASDYNYTFLRNVIQSSKFSGK